MSAAKKPVPQTDLARQRNADVGQLSYEAAREELVSIVGRLEGGQAPLEESMHLWERGEALAAHCEAWLDGAERRLRRDERPPHAPGRDGDPAVRDDEDESAADAEPEADAEPDAEDPAGPHA